MLQHTNLPGMLRVRRFPNTNTPVGFRWQHCLKKWRKKVAEQMSVVVFISALFFLLLPSLMHGSSIKEGLSE